MSALSRCNNVPDTRPAESAHWLLFILFVAVLILLFGLGQLHLRFAVDDLERETNGLQTRKWDLPSEINALRAEVEAAKRGGALLARAESELDMVQVPPSQWERIEIPREIAARYAEVPADAIASAEPEDERGAKWLASLAGGLGLAGEASAGR